MSDKVRFSCPSCRKRYSSDIAFGGYQFSCDCGRQVKTPNLPTSRKAMFGKMVNFTMPDEQRLDSSAKVG